MSKLKLGPIPDDKPVKLTVELPAALHRDLIAYAEILGREARQEPIEPSRLEKGESWPSSALCNRAMETLSLLSNWV